jgi:PKHD-type hydroxylase
MNLKYNYWYFRNAIKPEICDRIIAMGENQSHKLGEINRHTEKDLEEYTEEDYEDLFKTRNSHISWIDEPWIYNLLKPYINRANEMAGWNFEWDYTETLQYTRYVEGQFYEWHPDQHHYTYPDDDTNEKMRGKYRKLSTTLLLNDPSEFEGGELEFHFNRTETCVAKELDTKGSLIVFPAFVYHRVRKVTKGIRNSLVSWNIGEPFR